MQRSTTDVAAVRDVSRNGADVVLLALVLLGGALAATCAAGGPGSRASVALVVERISAPADGAAGDANRTFVESDVATGATVVQDTAHATLRLVAKDPAAPVGPTAPSGGRFATIDRYRVRYVRSDGRNAPGIDVPHPWDGALTLAPSFEGETGEFVLVRASAKLDPPLVTLRAGGGDVVINTLAYVTFYGRDHGGARLEATGAISVVFADWADAEPAPR